MKTSGAETRRKHGMEQSFFRRARVFSSILPLSLLNTLPKFSIPEHGFDAVAVPPL
jgi:hypothetical protein